MAKTAVLKPFLAVATDKMKAKTVAELQARTEFKEGDVVEVLGELVAGDGKHHMRIASKVADASGVQGQGGLFWNVVPNSLISLIAQAIEQNKSDILLKLDKGEYNGNAQNLKNEIDNKLQKANGKPDTIDLSTVKGLTDLREGTYNCGLINIYGLPTGNYWTVQKITDNSVTGDWHIFAYQNGTNRIWKGKSNNSTWQGWSVVFTEESCPISKTQNGWCRLANGLIIQWGTVGRQGSTGSAGWRSLTFPMAFSSYTSYSISFAHDAKDTGVGDYMYSFIPVSFTKSSLDVWLSYRRTDNSFTPGGAGDGYKWIAVGY